MKKPIIILGDGTEIFDINIGTETIYTGLCETCAFDYDVDYLYLETGDEDTSLAIEINSSTINVGTLMRLFTTYYSFIKTLSIEQLSDLIQSINNDSYYEHTFKDFISENMWIDLRKNII